MNVSLTPALEKMVKQKVKSGDYNNASEVIRDALRMMKENEIVRREKLKKLRAAIAEGEMDFATGQFTTIENDEELKAFFAKL